MKLDETYTNAHRSSEHICLIKEAKRKSSMRFAKINIEKKGKEWQEYSKLKTGQSVANGKKNQTQQQLQKEQVIHQKPKYSHTHI